MMAPERVVDRLFRLARSEGDCLVVRGRSPQPNGYVMLGWREGAVKRRGYVHRIAYAHYHGSIPDGMVVAHTCDNRKCIATDHLVATTTAGNQADMVAKGRSNRGDRHWNWRGGTSKNFQRQANRLHGAEKL